MSYPLRPQKEYLIAQGFEESLAVFLADNEDFDLPADGMDEETRSLFSITKYDKGKVPNGGTQKCYCAMLVRGNTDGALVKDDGNPAGVDEETRSLFSITKYDKGKVPNGGTQKCYCAMLVRGNTDGALDKDDGNPAVGMWFCGVCSSTSLPVAPPPQPLPSGTGATGQRRASRGRSYSDAAEADYDDDDVADDDDSSRVARSIWLARSAPRSRERHRRDPARSQQP
ncbi:hypothetical protein GPECTOR_49g466 [Gonium pectorale]|uniref:Uncharacterized protein n=1 Tax=Gonium pectorale TaxID=33097 RepID=A0A150G7R1_GONPE|nr:hypothetical protein GPECTOR_49g466 [Gonium pectorale]|eukprot:KXZ45882.1 hypothetical protein GPECTOR_49g466 [Gonium pectorale]